MTAAVRLPQFADCPNIVRPARICLVGQSPGTDEMAEGRPFVGPAGRELQRWAAWGNFDLAEAAILNVFGRPFERSWLTEERPVDARAPFSLPVLHVGKTHYWLRHEHWHWLQRLEEDLQVVRPNILVALGSEALWALSGGTRTNVGAAIGTIAEGPYGKYTAVWHPSHIIRGAFNKRVDCVTGLLKAVSQSHTPEAAYPVRRMLINPTLGELRGATEELLAADRLAVDVETVGRQITEITFTPSPTRSFIYPFCGPKGERVWSTAAEEVEVWRLAQALCESPVPKVLQNGSYDAIRLWEPYRIKLVNYAEDTRLKSHALFPELPKALRWMAAVWGHERDWKKWRREDTGKRDD